MKRALLLIFLCFLTVSGYAQNTFQREFAVGVSGGATFSSISFIPKVYQGQLMGYTGGLMLRWITENHLGLQFEGNYVQQGWQEDFPDYPDMGYKYSRTGNYAEAVFLTHIYFGSNRARFYINAGPKVGYFINESTDSNLGGVVPQPNRVNEQHDMPIENFFDWGLCGGPGFELRTGIGSFLLEGRYYYALGDIFGNSKADVFAKSSQQVMSVKLGYLIRFK